MRRPQEIAADQATMSTIVNLTTVFEGIASLHIAQIKNQVLASQEFFAALWQIYSQLRVDSLFRLGRQEDVEVIDKELFIAITAEGGFSGDIDQKLIDWMLKSYDPKKHDIVIIGHHGALQLTQAGVSFRKYFKLPERDQHINVKPLIKLVQQYRTTTVYYQTYVSLMVQDIKKIELIKAVQQAGEKISADEDIISESNYIFEPNIYAVVAHLESSMLNISLSQTILDSKLAQYASRFRAMSVAKKRSVDAESELRNLYNHAKRATSDERLKEMINGIKKVGAR